MPTYTIPQDIPWTRLEPGHYEGPGYTIKRERVSLLGPDAPSHVWRVYLDDAVVHAAQRRTLAEAKRWASRDAGRVVR